MTEALKSYCIVADDLSGAADCAAAFARVAGPVPVYLGEVGDRTDRLAMDTDTRTMDSTQAAAVTTRAFERITRTGSRPQLVYKKIDSTLRGHIGVELLAALRAAPQFAGAVACPAFPEQGRTLEGGQLRVHGHPVQGLGHAGDLMGLLHRAGLAATLIERDETRTDLARRLAEAFEGGARVVVVDAADEDDLARLAAALGSRQVPRVLVVGSAGLARALAAHYEAAPEQPVASPEPGSVIALVGSFSKASFEQVQQVQDRGAARVIRLDAAQWLDPRQAPLRQKTLVVARQHLRGGDNVLFTSTGEVQQSRSLVLAMARLTAPLLEYAGTCVLTGGDTARAMLNELGVDRLIVSAEFEPGISVGHAAACPSTVFVLKAGGFGDAQTLQRIVERFGRQPVRPL